MKKFLTVFIALICVCSLVACNNQLGKFFGKAEKHKFYGHVLEVYDDYLLIEPANDGNERNCADKFYVSFKNQPRSWQIPVVDDYIEIIYDGYIIESYPAQHPAPPHSQYFLL